MLLTLRKIITMRVIEQAEDIIEREQLGDSILSYTTENFKILERNAITSIAKDLNLARGTVTRWISLNNVPPQYTFDLMKLAREEIDYSKFSAKEKDQFFTPHDTAEYCYSVFKREMELLGLNEESFHYIEPSAGDGAFMRVLPRDRSVGLDIEPKADYIIKHDYLTWEPTESKNYVVFGNPPFGLRGHLALQFIEHSAKFSDFVCFILPQLFESDGKGSPRKRVGSYNLYHSEKIETNFYDPDGRQMRINVVFQIWAKDYMKEEHRIKTFSDDQIKVYSLSNGASPSQQRNTDMLDKCDIYLPSTCFGEDNMRCYPTFEELPGQKGYGVIFKEHKQEMIELSQYVDWPEVSFLSTNSAFNLRTSKIKETLLELLDNC
mgnify:CR=1 FL=1